MVGNNLYTIINIHSHLSHSQFGSTCCQLLSVSYKVCL